MSMDAIEYQVEQARQAAARKAGRRAGMLLRRFRFDCSEAAILRRKRQPNRAERIIADGESRVWHALRQRHGFVRVARHAHRIRRALDRVEREES